MQVRAIALTLEAAELLARVLPHDTGGPAPQVGDLVKGCDVFGLFDGEQLVGAFAARQLRYSDGLQICINAAGGLPGYDLTGAMDDWAHMQARDLGASSLTCTTRRPGLVRMLERRGYQVAGTVLRKDL